MLEKLGRAKNLILLLIFSLVALGSIKLTVDFIKPPPQEDVQTTLEETTVKVEKDKDETLVGNLTGNLIQHYEGTKDYGLVASNNKYIFKFQEINNTNCLTRTKIKDGKLDIVLTGYKVKSLNIIKNNLYMIVKQYEDGKPYEVISYMDIEKSNLNPINETKTESILSFVSDGKNIYYTIKDDYNIYKIDKDNIVTKLYETDKSAEIPFIIGINNGLLYYVNGFELCSLGIHSRTNTVLSNQYCSIEQYPILNKDHIVCFYDLAHTRLDVINLDGTYKQTIIEKNQTKQIQSRINSINYSCGYIFLSTDDAIYYLDKHNSLNEFKEAKPKTSTMYLTDEYIILENSENTNPEYHKIVWLLAS